VAKSRWSPVVTGVFEPFLYLLSVGVGVSVLVGDIVFDGRTYDYTTFVAPAMLASAAMSGAIAESTYSTYGKFKWDKTYEAMTATPLTPGDIAVGELARCPPSRCRLSLASHRSTTGQPSVVTWFWERLALTISAMWRSWL